MLPDPTMGTASLNSNTAILEFELPPPPPLQPPPDEMLEWKERLDAAIKQSKDDSKKYDTFVTQYRRGSIAPGSAQVKDNQTFGFVNALLSLMYSQNPEVCIIANQESGAGEAGVQRVLMARLAKNPMDAKRKFAHILETVVDFSYGLCRTETQNNATLFEGICRGLGFSKTMYDPQRRLGAAVSLRRDEVFVDPGARCDISKADYVIQTCTETLRKAKKMFADMGYERAEEIKPNFCLSEGVNLTAKAAKKNDPSKKNDRFRFFECWSKDGDQRFIDYFDYDKNFMYRREWPFVLEYDEYPYEDLAFNKQYTQVNDAFPDLEVVEGIRKLQENCSEFTGRHMMRTLANKIVFDSDIFGEQEQADLMDEVDMKAIGVSLNGRKIGDVLQVVNMTDRNGAEAFDGSQAFDKRADKIVGMNEIEQGTAGERQPELTATHAEIIDQYSKLRLGRRQKLLDEWLIAQVRHVCQITRQLVDADTVRKICGAENALIWEMMAPDLDDLTHEYTITVVAGSSGERAKREKITRLQQMRAMMAQSNKELGYERYDIAAIDMRIFQAMDEVGAEEYVLPPPPPKTAGANFEINGASVEGLNKLMAPGTVNSPTGTIETGVPPLMTWEEARQMLGLPVVMNAELPPQAKQALLKMQQASIMQQNAPPSGFASNVVQMPQRGFSAAM